jgi:hypothetical protein
MKRMYADDFTNNRRKAWVRSRSQAWYRKEEWNLTFAEFCVFWDTPELWAKRGRSSDSWVLTRRDPEAAWNRTNCCLLNRRRHLQSQRALEYGEDLNEFYQDAINYGDKNV